MTPSSRNEQQRQKQGWIIWIERHRATLKSIGLPPEVYLDLEHWCDFLQNGYLERHPESSTGFDFSQMSTDQMRQLLEFLDAHDEFHPDQCEMPGWLRVRCGFVE